MGKPNNQNHKPNVKKNNLPVKRVTDDNENQNRVEQCWNIYSLINGWIEKTDNKVSVSIAVFSAAFGVFTFISQSIYNEDTHVLEITTNDFAQNMYIGTFVLSLLFFLISILFYVITIIPNLKSNNNTNKNQRKDFPLFFNDIANTESDKYRSIILNYTDKQLLDELIAEIYQNSLICSNKMKNFRTGVILSAISLVLSIISLCIHVML